VASFRVALIHGLVRGTRSGPAWNSNLHYMQRALQSTEFIEEPVDVVVTHAYPATGDIAGYVRSLEDARTEVRDRSVMVNARSSGPVGVALNAAAKLGASVIVGPVYEVAGPRHYITTFMATPDGEIVKYRRMCLTEREKALGLSPGKSPAVFPVLRDGREIGRIGVYSGADLACPEVFRGARALGADLMVGHSMPSPGHPARVVGRSNIVTVDPCVLDKLLTVRAMDAGVPLVHVGAVMNLVGAGGRIIEKHWAPTTVVDPEGPGIESCLGSPGDPRPFLGVDEVGSIKRVIVEPGHPRPGGGGGDDGLRVYCRSEYVKLMRGHCRG